jgi:transposase
MTAAYSTDLREKIIASYEAGEGTQQEIADFYNIHLSTFKRIYKQLQKTGSVALAPSQAGRPARIDEEGYLLIKEYVLEKPDATLAEIKEHYTNRKNTIIGVSVIGRALQKLDFRRKKKSSYASEQEREDVKKKSNLQGKHGSYRCKKPSFY